MNTNMKGLSDWKKGEGKIVVAIVISGIVSVCAAVYLVYKTMTLI